MILLAIEATGEFSSVALQREGQLFGSDLQQHGWNLSGSLLVATQRLLQEQSLTFGAVDAFGISVGPGSFTGLKISVTIAKTWARQLQKPLAVSTAFEAVVWNLPSEVPVLALLSARKDALYAQWLLNRAPRLPQALGEPQMVLKSALLEWLRGAEWIRQDYLIAGPAAVSALEWLPMLPKQPLELVENAPTAQAVAEIASLRIEQGETVSPLALTPLYIQPPSIHVKSKAN